MRLRDHAGFLRSIGNGDVGAVAVLRIDDGHASVRYRHGPWAGESDRSLGVVLIAVPSDPQQVVAVGVEQVDAHAVGGR